MRLTYILLLFKLEWSGNYKTRASWRVTWVNTQSKKRTIYHCLAPNMKALQSFGMSVTLYQSALCSRREDLNLRHQGSGDLGSETVTTFTCACVIRRRAVVTCFTLGKWLSVSGHLLQACCKIQSHTEKEAPLFVFGYRQTCYASLTCHAYLQLASRSSCHAWGE